MCLVQNVLSILGFVAALCTYVALLKAWFSVGRPGYLTLYLALQACKFESATWLPALPVRPLNAEPQYCTADSANSGKCFKSIRSPQLCDLTRSREATTDKNKNKESWGPGKVTQKPSTVVKNVSIESTIREYKDELFCKSSGKFVVVI